MSEIMRCVKARYGGSCWVAHRSTVNIDKRLCRYYHGIDPDHGIAYFESGSQEEMYALADENADRAVLNEGKYKGQCWFCNVVFLSR